MEAPSGTGNNYFVLDYFFRFLFNWGNDLFQLLLQHWTWEVRINTLYSALRWLR